MATELGESPLLTNEDHHLIQAVLHSQHMDTHTQELDHTQNNSPFSRRNVQWWSTVLMVMMSILLSLLMSATLLHISLPLGAALLMLLWRQGLWWWVWLSENRAWRCRQRYYQSFDLLLLQLTATLRWLQEMEVIGQGFACPFPLSRHAYQSCDWHRSYRHVKLRRQLLTGAARLVSGLRDITVGMCKDAMSWGCGQKWLGREAFDRRNYLAYTDIHNLHPHLTKLEEAIEDAFGMRALELESLKVSGWGLL